MTVEETYQRYRDNPRKRRSWAADNPGNQAIRAELLAFVLELAGPRLEGGGEILDIGCGGGWLLERLAERGVQQKRLHGVDLLRERVEVARRRLPEADLRLADARELPHDEGEFTLVTLMTCLSSLPNRTAILTALAEAKRILAPGGLLLIYEPSIPNPLNRATTPVPPSLLRQALGPEQSSRRLTGLPPLARRLGRLTPHVYPVLSRSLPTHRLTAWSANP